MRQLSFIALVTAAGLGAPAMAQQVEPPRFEAFEQQQRDLNQQRLDSFDRQRQNEILTPPLPGTGDGGRADRMMEIERERQRTLLEFEVDRQAKQRERDIATANLPQRTILPSAPEVVDNPQYYALPKAPAGQYYARVDGRFVLVDGATNRPVKSFNVQPDEAGAGIPAITSPRPAEPPTRYQKLARQPALPEQLIAADSALVVKDLARLNLGAAPKDTYYASIEGSIYLVDAKTQKAIALIRK